MLKCAGDWKDSVSSASFSEQVLSAGVRVGGGLGQAEVDRALQRTGEECDRIAQALLAMDDHPGHQLLRAATLTGRTQQRWAQVSTSMVGLWEQFEAYRGVVERARSVRARRARPGQAELDELTELLTGAVVELNQEQLPIDRRTLTGPALSTERVTLAELVTTMKAAYATVTAVLAEVDATSSMALCRIDPLESQLRSAIAVAELVGPTHLDALTGIRDRVAAIRSLAVSDPLAIDSDHPLRAADADLGAITRRLAELTAVRASFGDRIGGIDAKLADLAAAHERARAVHAEVRGKVIMSGLPEIVDLTPPLRNRLSRLPALAQTGEWGQAAIELDWLDRAVEGAHAEASSQLAAYTGLLDRRAELRGRLDAYQAKAARLGRAEDLDLTALHRQAHDLLFTAPCDLAAATVAVNRYQQAVRPGADQEGSR
jgi:hypothetical protein